MARPSPVSPDVPPLMALAQIHLGNDLAAFIRDHKDRRESWDRVAKELYMATERQIDVSGQTVQAWAKRLGIEAAA